MASLDEIKITFFEECSELLEDMEAGLIAMNDGDHDPERVNAVFRAAHSIKGGAGAFGFDDLVAFAHRFETTLDEVRSGSLEPSEPVMAAFLRASDQLADLVAAARDDVPSTTDDALLAELSALTGAPAPDAGAEPEDDAGFMPMTLDFTELAAPDLMPDPPLGLTIRFRPTANLYRRGNEPVLLFAALAELGILECRALTEAMPSLDDTLDAFVMPWELTLRGSATEEQVREVFEFVEDDADLDITPIDEAPANDDHIGAEENPPPPDPAEASAPQSPAAPSAPTPPTAKAGPKPSMGSIRVDLERVDRLINLVGELVVNQAMLSQSVIDAGLTTGSPVAMGLDEFKNLTREVQDSVMAIRAQPVRSLFQRMSRIVREAGAATSKQVRLVTEGEATEIDKTVIDLLADPLTHMIRNAIDHGIESADRRIEAGKTEHGTVRLSAAHRSGRVMIEIADDGAGINRERVKDIAIRRGLIADDAQLTPNEIDNLLFLPGFSTAETVSNLSGRGVGMDVVKQAIQKLGGRISISSAPGAGSAFTISLPLTLAVLDGMVVRVDGQTLVVPLTSIVETLRPDGGQLHHLGRTRQVIHVRDSFVPIIDLGVALGFPQPADPTARDVLLLIDSEQNGQTALALDRIVEQRQVVIKSLEDNYGHVDGIAAATILGNGRIALILDPDALVIPSPLTGEAKPFGGAA